MKKILLILTCIAVLLSLVGCAEATETDYDETHYSDSDVTEADEQDEVEEPAPKYTGHISTADFQDCTVTVSRMFDVQALNDPIALADDELTEFVSTIENAEISEEPVELEDFDADSVTTHYTISLSDGSEIELSSYKEYIVINDELFTIDEDSLDTTESYFLETYAEDYMLHEICYAEYKLETGEWSEQCYNQVRLYIIQNSWFIANPDDYSYYSGDWWERREREQTELDEILSEIDDILPYVLKDDGTVNEDRYVDDDEMLPYKIDEPLNPLLTADFEGSTVYIERDYTTSGSIAMDEETAEGFLALLMSLEMDETPMVDDNFYEGGISSACYTVALSDGSEYRIRFMSVSAPVGNGLHGSARYVIIGGYKYSVAIDDDLFEELYSYYYAQYLADTTLDEFCSIMDACFGVAPGTAGSSLRSVSAAASLLDWATGQSYMLTEKSLDMLLDEWDGYDWDYEDMEESWESVVGSIEEIVADPADEMLLGLLDDSGYELQHDEYSEDVAELLITTIGNHYFAE